MSARWITGAVMIGMIFVGSVRGADFYDLGPQVTVNLDHVVAARYAHYTFMTGQGPDEWRITVRFDDKTEEYVSFPINDEAAAKKAWEELRSRMSAVSRH